MQKGYYIYISVTEGIFLLAIGSGYRSKGQPYSDLSKYIANLVHAHATQTQVRAHSHIATQTQHAHTDYDTHTEHYYKRTHMRTHNKQHTVLHTHQVTHTQ